MMFALFLIVFVITLPRVYFWCAYLQQKEYRLDRLRVFLLSAEGKEAIKKFYPWDYALTRTSLKRPHQTMKMILIEGLFSLLFLSALFFTNAYFGFLYAVGTFLILYTCAPVLVLLSAAPFAAVTFVITRSLLRLSSIKVRRYNTTIIGITGSYGKTTTKALLAAVLQREGSLYTLPASHNTPLSIALHILKDYHGEKTLLIEYAAYKSGEISLLTNHFPPHIAVITGFAPQHIGLFGSQQAIAEEKGALVRGLVPGGTALINDLDDGVTSIMKTVNRSDIHVFGISVLAPQFTFAMTKELQFTMTEKSTKTTIQTKFFGTFYQSNFLLAVAAAQQYKRTFKEISQILEHVEPPATALRVRTHTSGALILDDGKTANEKGFMSALELLKQLPHKKKYVVTEGIIDLGKESTKIHIHLARAMKTAGAELLHVGTEGRDVMYTSLGQEPQNPDTMIRDLQKLTADSAMLIEGHIPKHYETALR